MPDGTAEVAVWSLALSIVIAAVTATFFVYREVRLQNRILREYRAELAQHVEAAVDVKFAEVLLRNFSALRRQEQVAEARQSELTRQQDLLAESLTQARRAYQTTLQEADAQGAVMATVTRTAQVSASVSTTQSDNGLGLVYQQIVQALVKLSTIQITSGWTLLLTQQALMIHSHPAVDESERTEMRSDARAKMQRTDELLSEQNDIAQTLMTLVEELVARNASVDSSVSKSEHEVVPPAG